MTLTSGSKNHIILLKKGNFAPVVTTSQILMRRHPPQTLNGADGHFGPKTEAAVSEFQKHHKLGVDGSIGNQTWRKLESLSRLKIIDVVDGTDPSLVNLEANDIRAAGGDPIVVFGMSNGVAVVMGEIVARAGGPNTVALLRIHGHGGKGIQNVTGGEINGAPHLAGISLTNFGQIAGSLMTIRHTFSPFGSVQLLGCKVGGGAAGRALVKKLADTWGVPVTAGVFDQLGGGANTFRFEGPTTTGYPSGTGLKGWSAEMEIAHGNVSVLT
ncbi:MAG: peptidoglycan-binding protein [Bryobacterales bacterium]|jgi:peptidoglycan hydrolase-like protein with peptidoglycan-binding domain|nr:peptidoglycan-binding protein [Bryobacterales bacterium]